MSQYSQVRLQLMATIIGSLLGPLATSQDIAIQLRPSPADIISERIKAQAALINAQARREEAHAKAMAAYAQANESIIHASSSKVDLDMKVFDAYWEKKRKRNLIEWNRLEERIENARKPMVLENARKVVVWERTIEAELDKIRPGIHSGDLLNRIASQVDLTSRLSSSSGVSSSISQDLATLDDDSLRSLKLMVSSINGPIDVSLESPLPNILKRWPYLFRDPVLREHSYTVNKIATRLFLPGVSNLEKYEIEQQFRDALSKATNAFYQQFPPDRKRTLTTSQRIDAAEKFLQELDRTISNFAEADSNFTVRRPSYFQAYQPQQRNVATLIQYMMKYGLQFGNATAGTEVAYDRLFIQMRDLARKLESAPNRDSITEPIINLDLDAIMKDKSDK